MRDPANVKVLGDREQLPFTIEGRTVRFFAGTPQTVRIISSGREQVHSLISAGDRVHDLGAAPIGLPWHYPGRSSELSHAICGVPRCTRQRWACSSNGCCTGARRRRVAASLGDHVTNALQMRQAS